VVGIITLTKDSCELVFIGIILSHRGNCAASAILRASGSRQRNGQSQSPTEGNPRGCLTVRRPSVEATAVEMGEMIMSVVRNYACTRVPIVSRKRRVAGTGGNAQVSIASSVEILSKIPGSSAILSTCLYIVEVPI